MANERKTESIVRKHFEKFLSDIEIEEQRSDNPKINKLLKNASKKGGGQGYPEFIISYKENQDLLIVIECKANKTKHESQSHDRYSDFAVDGVLLYASYLSKDFDVLAIAVSGETKKELKVSHFLHLRGEKKSNSIFGNDFLDVENYLDGYFKSPAKCRQDYHALLDFTRALNSILHTNRIEEKRRALLISAILLALENKSFKKGYPHQDTPMNLAASLIQAALNELRKAKITGDKLNDLKTEFGFIETDTSLSCTKNVLKKIIDEIDAEISKFTRTNKYFDFLGQLYIEFLRYVNKEKGLGIVLTPPHITELFADLAQVNKNSIVYDSCTGTGGFLISAMKKMIDDANGNEVKIKEIKSNQLIGVEYQTSIFALAVSNMYIHQDGKTNVIKADCLDMNVIQSIQEKNATVGLLNPPYKSNKSTDTDELEFVLNNLECLIEGGICVAIVPMQSALSQSGRVLELKRELLEKHTLEAVLSMPNELFFNSQVSVVCCIMIFTAHKQHPNHKETYFGYYKDDGFVKRKGKGRIDADGKWDAIKEKWISNYVNRKNESGFSIKKIVTAEMEWAAEAYMETDYSTLNISDFEDTLKKYVAFEVLNSVQR